MSSSVEIQLPFAIKWTVKESDLKALGPSNSGALNSKRKRLNPHIQYHLSCYPYGTKEDSQTTVVLNLELGRSHKVSADFTLQILPNLFSENVSHFFEKTGTHACFICSSEELFNVEKKYFVDGEMTIYLHGILKYQETQMENVATTNARNLGKALFDRSDKDFAFVVKGQQIMIHKYILGVQSPVFDKITQTKNNNFVEIPNFPFEVVEIIVKLCYDIHVPESLIYENKVQLFEFADQYQMDSIKEMIETFIIKKLSVINVCSIANCSIVGKAMNLQKHCYNLLMKCLKEETVVADLKILNKDFQLKLLEDAFVFNG
uniref:BTB domain-containing protein n=1 Tax=Panagrolaimus sp. ES5 TaxID=591445 RepID=A0AC34F9B5_9BILA